MWLTVGFPHPNEFTNIHEHQVSKHLFLCWLCYQEWEPESTVYQVF